MSFFLKRLGRFLIYDQNPQQADVIVVLNGRDTERSLAAVDLYQKGYSNLIIMARGPKQPGSEEFWKRVGTNFDGKPFFQRAIEAMGVPDHSFKWIGEGVGGTSSEAEVIKRYVMENGYRSLLIVTSKWHSKRAYCIFKSTFKNSGGIEISVHASKYDTFNPEAWWRTKKDLEILMDEYIRYIYFWINFLVPTQA